MQVNRREAMILAASAAGAATLAASTGPAAAQSGDPLTFVQVNMWDRGPDVMAAFDMSNRIMLGTPGRP